MAYDNSLPPSFLEKVIEPESGITVGDLNFADMPTTADAEKLVIDPTNTIDTGIGNAATFKGWTFITAPEDISWDLANQANRVDMFGTNNPPVVAGSRGMRDLTLGNSLVEGFVRGKQVEAKIEALENLMNYSLNSSDGFVSVPVYQVWANKKSYGGPEAYYIIKDIKVKETMRDLTGNATRAFVDISLMQVPAYQVNSGRDQASSATAGVKSALISTVKQQANQNIPGKGSSTSPSSPGAKAASGAASAKPDPAKAPTASNPTTGRQRGVSRAGGRNQS